MPVSTPSPKLRQALTAFVEQELRLWRAAPRRLLTLIDIQNERRRLSELSDAELRDIGVERSDADVEARRSFWDAPRSRL